MVTGTSRECTFVTGNVSEAVCDLTSSGNLLGWLFALQRYIFRLLEFCPVLANL